MMMMEDTDCNATRINNSNAADAADDGFEDNYYNETTDEQRRRRRMNGNEEEEEEEEELDVSNRKMTNSQVMINGESYLRMLCSNAMQKMEYENAIFIAERLFAMSSSSINSNNNNNNNRKISHCENLLILQRCYRMNKQPMKAYEVLKESMNTNSLMVMQSSSSSSSNNKKKKKKKKRSQQEQQKRRLMREIRYFFASAAYEIGKLSDAECALTQNKDSSSMNAFDYGEQRMYLQRGGKGEYLSSSSDYDCDDADDDEGYNSIDEEEEEDEYIDEEENRNPNPNPNNNNNTKTFSREERELMKKKQREEENLQMPGGAYGEYLLGKIAKDTGRRQLAIDSFKRALALDPFMWTAFNELCSMGADDYTFAHTKRVETFTMSKTGTTTTTTSNNNNNNNNNGFANGNNNSGDEEDVIFFGAPNFNFGNMFSPEVMLASTSAARYNASTNNGNNTNMFLRRKPITSTMNNNNSNRQFQMGNQTATTTTTTNPYYRRGGGNDMMMSANPPPRFDLGDAAQTGERNPPPPLDGGLSRYVTPSPLNLGIHETPVVPRKPPQYQHGGKLPASNASTAFNTNEPVILTQQTAPLGGDGVSSNPFNDRRKFMDEGKLRKVSGRLFGDAPDSTTTAATTTNVTFAAAAAAATTTTTTNDNNSSGGDGGLRRSSRLEKKSQGAPPPLPPVSFTNNFMTGTQTPSMTPITQTPMTPAQMFDQTATTAKNPVFRNRLITTQTTNHHNNNKIFATIQLHEQQQLHQQHNQIIAINRGGNIIDNKGGCVDEMKIAIPKDSVAMVASIFHPIMSGVRHLAMFRCQEAIAALKKCTPEQYETGYVLTQVGKAYAEAVEYTESAKAFERAREIAPYNLDGIDCYSTVLWHLKREVELSHLAREAQAIDRLHPHTWCALGNCFSLQREHDSALRFFARAIQLNPKYAYGYTLRGHEHFANEDFEKAMECYRAALSLDPRHYNAWYGLGTVYFRQEKYEMSEHHFKHAIEINSKSSVLFCYLGMAQHALRKMEKAYVSLQKAIQLDERNPLAKYEKASVLMSEERYSEALDELEQLREVAPREASVYFLMGRIFKKLEMPNRAMLNFSTALDLKPSSADVNSIKAAIEKLHVPEEDEEEEL